MLLFVSVKDSHGSWHTRYMRHPDLLEGQKISSSKTEFVKDVDYGRLSKRPGIDDIWQDVLDLTPDPYEVIWELTPVEYLTYFANLTVRDDEPVADDAAIMNNLTINKESPT